MLTNVGSGTHTIVFFFRKKEVVVIAKAVAEHVVDISVVTKSRREIGKDICHIFAAQSNAHHKATVTSGT